VTGRLTCSSVDSLQPDEDVQLVIDLELRLLQPLVRASPAEVDKLLHPDFTEFGASGRTWDRAQMITSLIGEQLPGRQAPVTASDITGVRLADDVVHVTYVSQRDQRYARRSSIWRRTDEGWRIYFHQGTVTHGG
jgi:hypothetical protein